MHAELIEAMKQAEREAWAKAGWGEPPKKPDWWAKDAACVLALLAAAGRLVPEGAVVVPRIATWEMIEAARDAGSDEESWGGIYDAFVSRSPYMPPAAPRAEDQA